MKTLASFTMRLAVVAAAFTSVHPVAAQTGPELDVRNYGAACNGTSDDARALQAAINALPSSGGTVLIPCKLGIGATGVRVSGRSNVTLRGTASGAGLRALARTGQGAPGFGPATLLVEHCTKCTIRDLDFDGNDLTVAPINLNRTTELTIQNNRIHDVGRVMGGALSSAGGQRNRYLNNIVENTLHDPSDYVAVRGMWLGNHTADTHEWNPTIEGNTLRNIGYTAIATHAIAAVVRNNLVDGTGGGACLKLVPPVGIPGDTLVEKNVFRGSMHGVQVEWGRNVTIRENTIERNKNSGIYTLRGYEDSTITNNIIRDNNSDRLEGWAAGIWLHAANNLTISNNQIYDSRSGSGRTQDNAIVIKGGAPGLVQDIRIADNVCRNNTAHGIAVETDGSGVIDNVSVTDNTCTENASYGILVNERSSGAIRNFVQYGNTLTANGRGAISNNTSGGTANPPADSTRPNVALTSPAPGQVVSGTVTLAANAADNAGVRAVAFLVNGSRVGAEDTAAPYGVAWNTTSVPDGTYTLAAVARDAAGNQATSAAVTVTVRNTTTPPPPPPPTTGQTTVVVNAFGAPAGNVHPMMELRLGDATVLTRWNVTANSATNYTFTTSNSLAGNNLRVYFVNDGYTATQDRNLYVNSLQVNGTVYPTRAPNVYSASCKAGFLQTFGLWCNGYFEFPTSTAAGR